jgi:glycosyltransferase involved in cell wall biosynthesis
MPDPGPIPVLTVITKLELGGAQQVALYTLSGLPREKYTRHLIAGEGGLLDAEARALPDVRVNLWPGFRHPIRPLLDLSTLWRLAAYLRRERIRLVHTHSSKAGLLGRLAAAWAGVPVRVHTVHGWPFHAGQPAPVRCAFIAVERWAARFTTKLIAVSEATRDEGLRLGIGRPEQYEVIYPGSDLSAFAPGGSEIRAAVRSEFGFPPAAPLVGMVACLKPQKAPQDLLVAAREVADRAPQVRFLLVGDGELRPALEAQLRKLRLEDTVKLAGWRQDVPRLMAAFDLLAHSSLWEGLPCVFAQAQAAGLPVLATDVAGAREIIANQRSGLLVPPGDPLRLAEALLGLLRDPARRLAMSQAAPAQARPFQREHMLAKTLELYARLLGPAA